MKIETKCSKLGFEVLRRCGQTARELKSISAAEEWQAERLLVVARCGKEVRPRVLLEKQLVVLRLIPVEFENLDSV